MPQDSGNSNTNATTKRSSTQSSLPIMDDSALPIVQAITKRPFDAVGQLSLEHWRPNKRQCHALQYVPSDIPRPNAQQLSTAVNQIERENFVLKQLLEVYERELKAHQETNQALEQQSTQISRENTELKERSDQVSNDTQRLREQCSRLSEDHVGLEQQLSQVSEENEEFKEQSSRTSQDLQWFREQDIKLSAEIEGYSGNWNKVSHQHRMLVEQSNQVYHAHPRELREKDARISDLEKRLQTGRNQRSMVEMSTQARLEIQTLTYHRVQRQLEATKADGRELIKWLEDHLNAVKARSQLRLQKLGNFVLAEQQMLEEKSREFGKTKNILDRTIGELQELIVKLYSETTALEAKLSATEDRVLAKDNLASALSKQVAEQSTKIISLMTAVAAMDTHKQHAVKAEEEKDRELKSCRAELMEVTACRNALEHAQLKLEAKHRECQPELEQKEADIHSLKKKHDDHLTGLIRKHDEQRRRDDEMLDKRFKGQASRIFELQAQNAGYKEEVSRTYKEKAELQTKAERYEEECTRTEKEKADLERKASHWKNEASKAGEEAVVLHSEVAEHVDRISSAIGELRKTTGAYSKTTDTNVNLFPNADQS